MTEIERQLRIALDLMDTVSVRGREERKRMAKAEATVLGVAEAFAKMEREGRLHIAAKEDKPNDEADSEKENV